MVEYHTPTSPEKDVSPELLQKVRAIQIKTNHLANNIMTGEYVSVFKGRGMEFNEVREYQPGDDIRLIEWNVTARMGQPYIKEFKEEEELISMLLVDVSSSGEFGSIGKLKTFFNSIGIDIIEIRTDRPLVEPVVRYFKVTEKRREI